MARFSLHPDRFFEADTTTRNYSRTIYEHIRFLPIVSPHGHIDPALFSENKPFSNPADLFIKPDHYLFRMLYSQGVSLEQLGIVPTDASEYEKNARTIWKLFSNNYYLFSGTPTGVWLDYELNVLMGITERPNETNADKLYDEIAEKLTSPEFLPRSLYEKFNIEVLSTTDSALDPLTHHIRIQSSGWKGRIIPSFRPDIITDIANPVWHSAISTLETTTGISITTFHDYLSAVRKQRLFFKQRGATATDHGVYIPYTNALSDTDVESLFQRALSETAHPEDAINFSGHMLMEHARMSLDDGLVMQIHPGCFRNHNEYLFKKFGADKGHDIPVAAEYTNNLRALLSTYGNSTDLTIILFTLDESTYTRELAPLAGHYPALKLGPAWWFNDSINGMMRFREMTTETAGFYNTVGFNDDTRALLSIPARHDVARRMDSSYLGKLVAKHIISMEDALTIAQDLTYHLVKKAYRL